MKNTKQCVALLVSLLFPLLASAQSAERPSIKSGDEWTYQNTIETGPTGWKQTHDEVTVERVTDSHIYFSSHQVGSSQAPVEAMTDADWSRVRNVDGQQQTVNKPLEFPLSAGKSWVVDYVEHNPNKAHSLEHINSHFKVVGFETIEVPAGKFKAIKIEAEGQWTAELAPRNTVVQAANSSLSGTTMVTQTNRTAPVQVSGRLYKAFWYVPEVGRWVKSVEEYYGSNDVRSQRFTNELESYKLSAD